MQIHAKSRRTFALIKRHSGLTPLCLLTIVTVGVLINAAGRSEAAVAPQILATNAAFVRYLQDPPWIKEMRYVESTYNEAGPAPGHITVRGWVNRTNRFAVQPDVMFFESLNPNPAPFAAPATPNQRVVEGISDRDIWQGNVDGRVISFSSLRPENGGSESNRLQRLLGIRMQGHINPVRFFGFPALQAHSFHLVASDEFEAVTAENRKVNGWILETYTERPVRLKYVIEGMGPNYYVVSYKYNLGDELPNYFDRKEMRDNREQGLNVTNRIEFVEYGVVNHLERGFVPEMFFTNLAVFTTTLIESNGQRFVKSEAGNMMLLGEKYDPIYSWASSGKAGRASKPVLMLILLITSAFLGLFLWIARTKKESQFTIIK